MENPAEARGWREAAICSANGIGGDTEGGGRERKRGRSAGSLNEANKTVKAVQTAGKSNIGEDYLRVQSPRFEGMQVVVVRFQRGRYMQAEAGGSRRQTENDRRALLPEGGLSRRVLAAGSELI